MSKRYCKADFVDEMILKSDVTDEINRMEHQGPQKHIRISFPAPCHHANSKKLTAIF